MKHKCIGAGPVYTSGFNRRSFIQVGILGGLGFTLPDLFRSRAADAALDI